MSEEINSLWLAPAGPPHANEVMLRDVFAIAALISIIGPDDDGQTHPDVFAEHAYRIADAMLIERQKQG